MKIIITKKDLDEIEQVIDPHHSFVFIILGDQVLYCDSTVGRMWQVSIADLMQGRDLLGDGHRKMLQEYLANNG